MKDGGSWNLHSSSSPKAIMYWLCEIEQADSRRPVYPSLISKQGPPSLRCWLPCALGLERRPVWWDDLTVLDRKTIVWTRLAYICKKPCVNRRQFLVCWQPAKSAPSRHRCQSCLSQIGTYPVFFCLTSGLARTVCFGKEWAALCVPGILTKTS